MPGPSKIKTDPTSLIIRLNFMLLGLFIVGYVIYYLNSNGAPHWVSTFLSPNSAMDRITLCETRITGLTKPNAYQIIQKDRKWLKSADTLGELNFLSMEKWFGANCSVEAENIKTADMMPRLAPSLIIKFVTNRAEPLFQMPDGAYVWQGKSFRSTALTKALLELENLPATPSQDSP